MSWPEKYIWAHLCSCTVGSYKCIAFCLSACLSVRLWLENNSLASLLMETLFPRKIACQESQIFPERWFCQKDDWNFPWKMVFPERWLKFSQKNSMSEPSPRKMTGKVQTSHESGVQTDGMPRKIEYPERSLIQGKIQLPENRQIKKKC